VCGAGSVVQSETTGYEPAGRGSVVLPGAGKVYEEEIESARKMLARAADTGHSN